MLKKTSKKNILQSKEKYMCAKHKKFLLMIIKWKKDILKLII